MYSYDVRKKKRQIFFDLIFVFVLQPFRIILKQANLTDGQIRGNHLNANKQRALAHGIQGPSIAQTHIGGQSSD